MGETKCGHGSAFLQKRTQALGSCAQMPRVCNQSSNLSESRCNFHTISPNAPNMSPKKYQCSHVCPIDCRFIDSAMRRLSPRHRTAAAACDPRADATPSRRHPRRVRADLRRRQGRRGRAAYRAGRPTPVARPFRKSVRSQGQFSEWQCFLGEQFKSD